MVNAPPWFEAARKEIGTRELPENRGPAIRRYIALAKCGSEGDPWCAVFANAMLESVGVAGTRSAMARSFEHNHNFFKLTAPALGCIVTFWRGQRSQGLGHVGFYNGEIGDYISTLGGNESDMVRVEMLRTSGHSFGLAGFYWPKLDHKGQPIPGPIIGKLPPQSKTAAGNGKVT
jgi:uncharacterized protein (TIGR02594 family)